MNNITSSAFVTLRNARALNLITSQQYRSAKGQLNVWNVATSINVLRFLASVNAPLVRD